MRGLQSALFLVTALLFGSVIVESQWLNPPTPGIPRKADGTPDLDARAPRTADGKPDFSGVWRLRLGLGYIVNLVADLQPHEIMPWADRLFLERMESLGSNDPSTVGCLPLGPRHIVGTGIGAQYARIVQTSQMLMLVYEDLTYRQIFLDGRELPEDPNPTFMGYSIGRWEGDTLVVETTGFNDRTRIDFGGHPHTEALRTTERFRRTSVGSIDLDVTLQDPGAYTRPWNVPVTVRLVPDTDLLEFVCNENESRRTNLTGRTAAEKATKIPSQTLSEYVGHYVAKGPAAAGLNYNTLDVRLAGERLLLDIDGKGNIPMMALTPTSFSVRMVEIQFRSDATGAVTHIELPNGAQLVRQPK